MYRGEQRSGIVGVEIGLDVVGKREEEKEERVEIYCLVGCTRILTRIPNFVSFRSFRALCKQGLVPL